MVVAHYIVAWVWTCNELVCVLCVLQNQASCVDGVNGYACTCVAGFTGTHCQTNINDCAADSCFVSGDFDADNCRVSVSIQKAI